MARMMKLLALLFPLLCTVDALSRNKVLKARNFQDQAESEIQDLQDTSNQALWKHAWEETLDRYHVAENDENAQKTVYPEAKKYYKSLIQARNRLQQQQAQQESEASNHQNSDEETLADLKQQMAAKLTAGVKEIKEDDGVWAPTTTTTTTTENADQVQMDKLKAAEAEKLTANMKNVKDDDAPVTTTVSTTESPEARQQREDNEKLAELKEKMAAKLTEDAPATPESKSLLQQESTTTTTTTMDAAEQEKTLALLKTGSLGGNLFARYKPAEAPAAPVVAAKPAPSQQADASSDSEGEVANDFDQYDNMDA